MRLSSVASKKSGDRSGSKVRKKHKRLDAICEKEYTRNHVDLNDEGGVVGSASVVLEPRRSSRVRRAPLLLDVSPPPPKKRKKFHRNVVVKVEKISETLPLASDSLKGFETSDSLKSRLRSRTRNTGLVLGEFRGLQSPRRKLFVEINEVVDEGNAMVVEDETKHSEDGKPMVLKSNQPGKIKAMNSSEKGENKIKLFKNNDESGREVMEAMVNDCEGGPLFESQKEGAVVIGNHCEGGPLFGSQKEGVVVIGNHREVTDTLFESELSVRDKTEQINVNLEPIDDNAETEISRALLSENLSHVDENLEKGDYIKAVEHKENEVEELHLVNGVENKVEDEKDVGVLTAGMSDEGYCHDLVVDLGNGTQISKFESALNEDKHIHSSGHVPKKPCIKEGRRCGLCGGGTDGKPPQKLAHDGGDSESEAYSGSSAAEEPNYDLCDGFGEEPGWLGRLLGPINDRYGIAGIWVHQHCAVWSPEVYFAGLGCLKNVRAALCRGRALKCTRCGRPGATIGCRVDRCPKTYHLPCARANGCIFDHRKFLIACTDHRHFFQPQYLTHMKKIKINKMKLGLRKLLNDALRKDIEAEEKWLENCGEDEEFLKRESKRLHRDLARIAPTYIGGSESEGKNLFQGWESVAGLQNVIRCLKEVVILPLLYPEFFDGIGITPPRGVLLHGYPGTGKTLVVRALIGACARGDRRIAYFARKGADCLGKYVGDAERQLRLLFQVAERCQPSVIFFDEIDGLAPCRTKQQDQTHISVVSTLLALLDGLKCRGSVVVIGATNRPEAVDPALRRPGRFDREIYFPLPSVDDRAAILALHTRMWPKPAAGNVLKWVAQKTAGFAGADLQALCTQAAITALKRSFPLHEILSAAGERGLHGKRTPLPDFYVEERDWLEAVSKAPPPCSRRESGMAANDIGSSPLPGHLIPCLLLPLSTLLIALYLDERISLPPILSKAATMIKVVIVSALKKRNMSGEYWWCHVHDFLQEPDIAKEIERKLGSSGVLVGDTQFLGCHEFCFQDDSGDGDIDSTRRFKLSLKHDSCKNFEHISLSSKHKSGFRILIAGNPQSGQRHLTSCLLHCFVGNMQIHKVDLATISLEGHGDVGLGITLMLKKCVSAGSCMLFMPRIDLWAVNTHYLSTGESEFCSEDYQAFKKEKSSVNLDQVTEGGEHKLTPGEELHDIVHFASQAWISFVDEVDSLSLSTSFIIMATSEISFQQLPPRVTQFFRSDLSDCSLSNTLEHTVPRFSVQIDENFDVNKVINLAASQLARELVHLLIQWTHQKSHPNRKVKEFKTLNSVEGRAENLEHSTKSENSIDNQGQTKSLGETSIKGSPLTCTRIIRSKSSVHIAISSFGYQVLRYPHFAELCWVTSKLKDGPSADIRGPWKGWPFNSCIVRPTSSLENVGIGSDSCVKAKGKSSLVRGLIAVGLSAYRGAYTSLREVSLEVRKVFDHLMEQINEKIQGGKDRYQYVRLLSQVAYVEDMVNGWAYTHQSLDQDAHTPRIATGQKLIGVSYPENIQVSNDDQLNPENIQVSSDNQLKNGKCNPSGKGSPAGETLENGTCIVMTKVAGESSTYSNGVITISEEDRVENVVLNDSSNDRSSLHHSAEDQFVDHIQTAQNGRLSCSNEKETNINGAVIDTDSELVRLFNHSSSQPSSFEEYVGGKVLGPTKVAEIGEFDDKFDINDHPTDPCLSVPSEILCSYHCCTDCINVIHMLATKILTGEFSKEYNWTIDDVHDVVSTVSVELLSGIKRALANKDNSWFDEQSESLRFESYDTLFKDSLLQPCHCTIPKNMDVEPAECSGHSKQSASTGDKSLPTSQFESAYKFIFRDGVVVSLDSDEDVSFLCKVQNLCLSSLVGLIMKTKKPIG